MKDPRMAAARVPGGRGGGVVMVGGDGVGEEVVLCVGVGVEVVDVDVDVDVVELRVLVRVAKALLSHMSML